MSTSISNPSPPQYHTSSSLVFHPYAHDSNVPPPALSARRVNRLNPVVQFPTFLYASEPPPPTARNKQRVRPTAAQLSELKALYAETVHPARDVREALGRKIGMRHQSVTNWFQNQRSTAKRRGHHTASTTVHSASQSPSRSRSTSRSSMASQERNPTPSAHGGEDDSHASGEDEDMLEVRGRTLIREPIHDDTPCEHSIPRVRGRIDPVKDIIHAQAAARQKQQQQQQQQLPLPMSGPPIMALASGREPFNNTTGPALNVAFPPVVPHTNFSTNSSASTSVSRSRTPPLLSSFQVSRPPSPEPLDDSVDEVPRGKRSRPTPNQLAALRALHAITASPSIEERTNLGREIGMELGKVTNWFRNLRQTARKKERRALETVGKALHTTKRERDVSSQSQAAEREYKRSKMADDDDDDDMSVSHANSGSFDTRSTVDEMDYEFDQPQPQSQQQQQHQHAHHRGDFYDRQGHYTRHVAQPFHGHQDDQATLAHMEHQPEPRRQEEQAADREREREEETESDSTHEAVTPEPQHHRAGTAIVPPPPSPPLLASTSTSSTPPSGENQQIQNLQLESQLPSHQSPPKHTKQASLDDAMLLLAFHSAQA